MKVLQKNEIGTVCGGDCTCTLSLLGWGGYNSVGNAQCDSDCRRTAEHARLISGAVCGGVAVVSFGLAVSMCPALLPALVDFIKATTITLLKVGPKAISV